MMISFSIYFTFTFIHTHRTGEIPVHGDTDAYTEKYLCTALDNLLHLHTYYSYIIIYYNNSNNKIKIGKELIE